jgi:EmrB/QacA subfamily drug resistance transporter
MPNDSEAVTYQRFNKREIRSVMIGLLLAMFLGSLDQTIVATTLSTMARDLEGWEIMSWVVSGYMITSTTVTPIYGRLSDQFGRRPLLLVAIFLFVASSIFCALADTMPMLVLGRFLQGIGGGGLRSVAMAVVADVIPPRERGRYQGYFSINFAIATVLGPVLGGLFARYLTWHWIFWINVPLGLVALALSNRQLKRLGRPARRPRVDWFGALLILLGSTPLLYALGEVEQAGGWGHARVLVPLGLGLASVLLLVWWETIAREPMLPLRLFRNRTFTAALTSTSLANMIFTSLVVLIPLNYQLLGLPADQAGIRLIPFTISGAIASFSVGYCVSRLGRARIFPLVGCALLTTMCGVMAWTGIGRSLASDLTVTFLLGATLGFQFNPVNVLVQNSLRMEDNGIGVSSQMFFRLMAAAFGVALFTAFLIGTLSAGARTVPGHEALGPEPGFALLHLDLRRADLDPALITSLAQTIHDAFSQIFLIMTGLAFLAFLATLRLKDEPLRGYAPSPAKPEERAVAATRSESP